MRPLLPGLLIMFSGSAVIAWEVYTLEAGDLGGVLVGASIALVGLAYVFHLRKKTRSEDD